MIATKPMFFSKYSATRATPRNAIRVRIWSRRTPSAWVVVSVEVPVPRAEMEAPPRWRSSESVSGSSGSTFWPISLRPPRTTNRIAARIRLMTRLDRKITISLLGRPALFIVELVMVP